MNVDECRTYQRQVLPNLIGSDLISRYESPEWSTRPLALNHLQQIKHLRETRHPLLHLRLPLHSIYLAE